jgi:hypothetical protein
VKIDVLQGDDLFRIFSVVHLLLRLWGRRGHFVLLVVEVFYLLAMSCGGDLCSGGFFCGGEAGFVYHWYEEGEGLDATFVCGVVCATGDEFGEG